MERRIKSTLFMSYMAEFISLQTEHWPELQHQHNQNFEFMKQITDFSRGKILSKNCFILCRDLFLSPSEGQTKESWPTSTKLSTSSLVNIHSECSCLWKYICEMNYLLLNLSVNIICNEKNHKQQFLIAIWICICQIICHINCK